jgi:hypothetical protein
MNMEEGSDWELGMLAWLLALTFTDATIFYLPFMTDLSPIHLPAAAGKDNRGEGAGEVAAQQTQN